MSENQTFQRITNIRRIARVAIQTKKEPIFLRDVILIVFQIVTSKILSTFTRTKTVLLIWINDTILLSVLKF